MRRTPLRRLELMFVGFLCVAVINYICLSAIRNWFGLANNLTSEFWVNVLIHVVTLLIGLVVLLLAHVGVVCIRASVSD